MLYFFSRYKHRNSLAVVHFAVVFLSFVILFQINLTYSIPFCFFTSSMCFEKDLLFFRFSYSEAEKCHASR